MLPLETIEGAAARVQCVNLVKHQPLAADQLQARSYSSQRVVLSAEQLETEHVGVEIDGSVEVGNFHLQLADPHISGGAIRCGAIILRQVEMSAEWLLERH